MDKYKISIVIPVYNNEKYIDECIKSIINQSIGFNNIQTILINDGSKDNSLEVLKKYEYDNVIIIDKENTGVSDTRNIGIDKAIGKYILFLDSDDYLSLNACSKLYNFFEKHYDEIDLVTYPIVYNINGKLKEHVRYKKVYVNKSGIYDLNSNYNIIQTTVNVMIKNNYNNNPKFEKKQNFSEDERFATEILMKKEKIGYCDEAIYYYRRHVGTANDTITNPIYTFETIMRYYEYLFKKYEKEHKVSKYIQALYLNNLGWRIKQNDLLPFHLGEKEYRNAVNRIKKLVSKIDIRVIMGSDNLDFYHKIFLLNLTGKQINIKKQSNLFKIYCDNEAIYEFECIDGVVSKIKLENGCIKIMASILNPIFSNIKPKLYIEKKYDNKIKRENIELFESNDSYYLSSFKTTTAYGFDISINIQGLNSLRFYIEIDKNLISVDFTFKKTASNNFVFEKKNIIYSKRNLSFKIRSANFINVLKSRLRNFKKGIIKKPRVCLYRLMYYLYPCKKNIWLYTDRGDTIDNAYTQFIHDFDKNDNINRYYVSRFNNDEIDKYFEDKHKKFLIKQGSLKHKMYYLKSLNILTSFVDIQVYCPFNNAIGFYKDLARYNLIYLQHGILHANLLTMYAKEFTEIDKFVISTNFEKDNLIKKYHYKEDDLLLCGMPRMKLGRPIDFYSKKNKILFAPSWRSYLIGDLVNNRRKLKKKEFLSSSFYKKIYDFLHSEELNHLLKNNQYTLDFKLHPIFNNYADLFDLSEIDNVNLVSGKTIIDNYDIFITDFSSFQFDFVRLKRPIIYFVPDMLEFKAGLHTYRELDLKYEDAFGKLCEDDKALFKELDRIIKNNCKVDGKYKKRMNNFFLEIKNPCEDIYNSIIQK